MRRVVSFLVLFVVALSACTNDPAGVSQPETSAPTSDSSPSPEVEEGEAIPPGSPGDDLPQGDVPRGATGIARVFKKLQPRLYSAIEAWVASGAKVGTPFGRAIARAGLLRQKIFRTLSGDERLERRVLAQLPARLDRPIKVHTAASRALTTLVTPVSGPIELPTKQPDPPLKLHRFYKKAQRTFGIPWQLLASINLVETRFGRLTGPSTAGAQGPMQFIPSTWAAYGNGGDVNDPHDAIMGAARYLRASGAPSDLRSAVFSYNHADAYVNAILTYYNEMRRDPRNFYAYYFWQVFVKTTKGDVQLTGPGGRQSHIR
jgi:Transglycosylase SLT domain